MYNLILADLFKLRKATWIRIIFAITILSSVLMCAIAYEIPRGKINTSFSGIGFLLSDASMISILGGVIAGIFICGDFDNKTIQDSISSGSSRYTIIVSKAIVFICSIAFILIPYAIVTGISLSTGYKFSMNSNSIGFLHIITTEAGKSFSASAVWSLLVDMLTLAIVYAAQQSVCILLAFVLKKPVVVVAINYGIAILYPQLTVLRNSSKIFDQICSLTPFGGNYTFITLNTKSEYIFKAIAVSLVFIILIIAITYPSFRRSEIK